MSADTPTVLCTTGSINNALGDLLRNQKMCDVTLTAEGRSVGAHVAVLAARSSVFQEKFSTMDTEGKSRQVTLEKVCPSRSEGSFAMDLHR